MMELYTCFTFVFGALEVYCCVWMFRAFAEKRRTEMKWITPVSVMALCCAEWMVANVVYENLIVKAVILVSLFSLTMFLLYRIRFTRAVILSMLFYGILLLADYMSLAVMGTVFSGRVWDLSGVFLFYKMRIFSIALAYGMIFCVRKMLGSAVTDIFTDREWYALAAISLITVFSVVSITYETDWSEYVSRPISRWRSSSVMMC